MKDKIKQYPYTLNHVVKEVNTVYFKTPYRVKKFLEECELYCDGLPTPDYADLGFSIEVKLRKDKYWARFNKFTYVRLSREAFEMVVAFLRYALDDTKRNGFELDLTDLEKSKIFK
jgi:hypothetical protein